MKWPWISRKRHERLLEGAWHQYGDVMNRLTSENHKVEWRDERIKKILRQLAEAEMRVANPKKTQ